jgi:hypothetical protein
MRELLFWVMHVLGKPIERHFAVGALCFGGVKNFFAHGGELRAHAYIVDEAGEISSIYGHLYLEAGNITECFVAGKIAGQNVAQENSWE